MPLPGRRDGALSLFHAVLAGVVVLAMVAGYLIYSLPQARAPPKIAVSGDSVSVDYTGRFDDGTVFDTSLKGVANNNETYPKAPIYSYRPNPDRLTFTLGSGAVVQGFDENVTGMREGDTKTFRLVADLAYGPSDPSKIEVRPLLEEVKWREEMTEEVFRNAFKADPPTDYPGTLLDPVWNWTVLALPKDTATELITITRVPVLNSTLRPFGAWEATVVDVNSAANRILVRHHLTPADAGRIAVRSGTDPFLVSAVDANTFALDHNQPLGLLGSALTFTVTLVSVTKAGTRR